MKITIYELLGMVKDGKAPKRFKYDSYIWTYNYESSAYWNGKGIEFEDYMDDGLIKYLNDEVEILEEEKKIPEKLYKYMEIEEEGCYENILRVYDGAEYEINEDMSFVIDKINSIIDYLKSKGDE